MIPPRFIFRRLMISLIVLMGLSAGYPIAGPAATAQTEADAAAEFAYGLSGLERTGNWDRLYDFLHPDAKAIVPRSAVVGWYREDFAPRQPQAIVEITAVRQVAWTWPVTGVTYPNAYEVDYVQPFGPGPTYQYVSETVRLVPSGTSFGWFFGRSREFVNEQIARFPGELETTAGSSQGQAPSNASSAPGGNAGCTLVELYPGYPGYRGNITGVMPHANGLGDWECLEALEQQNPAFDRAGEDRANQQAAAALGINGGPELWTWENWLQIEAERGLQPSCYTCLMVNTATTPTRTDIEPTSDDPRLKTGFMGGTNVVGSLLRTAGVGGVGAERTVLEFYGNDDYVLRALAHITGGTTLNAEELLHEMQRLVEFAISPAGDLDDLPSWNAILNHGIWQHGGYTWTPDKAAMEDQVLLMLYTYGAATTNMLSELEGYYFHELQRSFDLWELGGMAEPLDSYMQQQPTWQEFRS